MKRLLVISLFSLIAIFASISIASAVVPCNDGINNDGDGWIDEEQVDGIDEDGDTLIDEDTNCICNNGIDDDGDTFVDEEAIDGMDNDGDTLIDEDPFCPTCNDGMDNDGDFVVDEEATDFSDNDGDFYRDEDTFCSCNDGVDYDGDTLIDEEAIDGMDNDGDTLIDEDNNCMWCGDGIDNDGDTLIDEEWIDGVDNDGDTLIDEDVACGPPPVEVVIDSAPANQQSQNVTWNSMTSEYLVVWQDFRNGAANPDIYGARLDANGNVIVTDIPIVTQSAKQAGPWVANAGGIYLVVWVDQRTKLTTGTDIYGAWLFPDGSMWGSDFIITAAPANQRAASVVYDPYTGDFLVTWTDDTLGANTDIQGVVLNPGGVVSGPFLMVVDPAVQRGPFVRYDWGVGQYFMVWFDNRNGNYDVYGSRVNSLGAMLDGSGLGISTAAGNQKNPRLADRDPGNGIGDYVLAWVDDRNGQKDIYGALVDGSGANVIGDFVIAGGPSAQVAASVDVDWINTKRAVVSWADNVNGVDYDVYRAEVDQAGAVSGTTVIAGLPTGAANQQQGPALVYSYTMMDNGFLACWRDNRSGVDYDLYGIKVWP